MTVLEVTIDPELGSNRGDLNTGKLTGDTIPRAQVEEILTLNRITRTRDKEMKCPLFIFEELLRRV